MKNWLAQIILYDEIIGKFKIDDINYADDLAWKYTQITKKFVPHKEILGAFEVIKKDLDGLRNKYQETK